MDDSTNAKERPLKSFGWLLEKKSRFLGGALLIILSGILVYAHLHKSAPTLQQVLLAQHNGQYSQAIALSKKAITETSNKEKLASLYMVMGNNYANSHDLKNAINAYTHAGDLGGMNANLALLLATDYQEEGDKTQAVQYYQQAAKLWPKSDPLYRAQVQSIQATINRLLSRINTQ